MAAAPAHCLRGHGWVRTGERRRSQLEEEEEEAAGAEEQQSRRSMDICVLTDQYRWSRDTQRTRTRVCLFRKVSQELTDTISIIAVNQGLSSSWEPNSSSPLACSPPAAVVDPGSLTYDPWHVHLDLHRRSRPSCPPVSRCSSLSSESRGRNLSESDSASSSVERWPCSSFSSTKEEDIPTGDEDPQAPHRSRPEESFTVDPLTGSPQDPPDSSSESQEGPGGGSDGSSTPVASTGGSTSDLHQDVGNAAPPQGYRKPPGLGFTRHLSVGGVGYNQNQNHYPFPSRRSPRISEAARRLGMYSSF
ncbi:uncharacterized protein LOC115411681 [Sphaeramia orbicularis]|uniref:uncharacterized protein LOC115411681 n=1 Tax=Sphaeramia orbicularis TaxID=375764 RepID=UPI00117F6453|nr:uncharacterized protein LOC115411681 [Sphaeramia orbicularis]